MKVWYRIAAAVDDPSAVDIYIIDFIGDWWDDAGNRFYGESIGVTARAFVEELSKLPSAVKTIRVHINSPGGDVQGGVNIANALRAEGSKGRTVETIIDGIAASAASIIAMAGSVVRMADNALIMIHSPWTIALGNAAEMRKTADILDTIQGQIVNTYKWHSTLSDKEIIALIVAETWMDADEAIAKGFATEKVEGLKAAAALDPKGVAKLNVPEKYKARVDALIKHEDPPAEPPKAATSADVLRVCTEAGLDLAFASALVASHATLDDVRTKVRDEQHTRAQATQRATDIRALCEKAKLPELADGYIQGAMAVNDIRAHLTTITAKLDTVEIDGSLPVDHGGKPTARISVSAVYAARNRLTTQKE